MGGRGRIRQKVNERKTVVRAAVIVRRCEMIRCVSYVGEARDQGGRRGSTFKKGREGEEEQADRQKDGEERAGREEAREGVEG